MREKLEAVKKLLGAYTPKLLLGVHYWHEKEGYQDDGNIRERFYRGVPVPQFAVRVIEACEIASKMGENPLAIYEEASKQLFFAAFCLQKQELVDVAASWARQWGLDTIPGKMQEMFDKARELAEQVRRQEVAAIAAQENRPAQQSKPRPTQPASKIAPKTMPVAGQTRVSVSEPATQPEFSQSKPSPAPLAKRAPETSSEIDLHAERLETIPVISDSSSITDKGKAIASTLQILLPKAGISFHETGKEIQMRHTVFTIEKAPAAKYGQIEGYLDEALSAAGYEPGSVFTEKRAFNRLEIHIPRPPDEWMKVNFIEFFLRQVERQKYELPTRELKQWFQILEQNEATPPSEAAFSQLKDLVLWLHNYLKSSPLTDLSRPLSIPIGVSMRDEPIAVRLDAGALLIGSSGGGKSNWLKSCVAVSMLMFKPTNWQGHIIDAERSAFRNFLYDGSSQFQNPWIQSSVLGVSPSKNGGPKSRGDDDDEAQSKKEREQAEIAFEENHLLNRRFAEIDQRYEQRLARFGDCEKVTEYNSLHPDDSIPFSPIFIDGVARLKSDWSSVLTDYWTWQAASCYRKTGMPLIIASQYSNKKVAVPPETRFNLDTTIAFKTSESGAEMAFGDSSGPLKKMVARLCGGGDFIMETKNGAERYRHVQGLYAPTALVKAVVKILCDHYNANKLEAADSLNKLFSR